MDIEFRAKLKNVAFAEAKGDDADPDEPAVVIKLSAFLDATEIGRLARFNGRNITVILSSAQSSFEIGSGADGRPALVPERQGRA